MNKGITGSCYAFPLPMHNHNNPFLPVLNLNNHPINTLSTPQMHSSTEGLMNKKTHRKQKPESVNPEPIDDRKFQELRLSGKSGILLGWRLNPKKCMGVKVSRIPKRVRKKWNLAFLELGMKAPRPVSWKNKTPKKRAITAPRESTKWKWATT